MVDMEKKIDPQRMILVQEGKGTVQVVTTSLIAHTALESAVEQYEIDIKPGYASKVCGQLTLKPSSCVLILFAFLIFLFFIHI